MWWGYISLMLGEPVQVTEMPKKMEEGKTYVFPDGRMVGMMSKECREAQEKQREAAAEPWKGPMICVTGIANAGPNYFL